jgi:UDP:flavonoid glycosyltransferase YjiC (YdhE family)
VSRISIIAIGSRGDVAPLTGLGAALQSAGHDVSVTAYSPFGAMITDCGLRFRELPAALESTDDPARELAAFASPAGMRKLGNTILTANAGEPADMLLLSPFAELAGHPLAEAKDIPALGVRLQPISATATHPPSVLGIQNLGRHGNRVIADAGASFVDRLYGAVMAGFRRDLGLPKVSARKLRRLRTNADWPVLHGYSPLVAPRPVDWRPGLEVTGYWWPPTPSHWEPPDDLVAFLADGPPPVFVGLGSVMTTAARARELSGLFVRAAELSGTRILVQSGWAGLDAAGDGVLTIGDVPHDWLFPQTTAVAHHCGAGTAAAGLRAGVPVIALPGHGDSAFWARRLRELGACSATIPQRRLTAERLAEAIGKAADPGVKADTERIASEINSEDGIGQAISIIEKPLP